MYPFKKLSIPWRVHPRDRLSRSHRSIGSEKYNPIA